MCKFYIVNALQNKSHAGTYSKCSFLSPSICVQNPDEYKYLKKKSQKQELNFYVNPIIPHYEAEKTVIIFQA